MGARGPQRGPLEGVVMWALEGLDALYNLDL